MIKHCEHEQFFYIQHKKQKFNTSMGHDPVMLPQSVYKRALMHTAKHAEEQYKAEYDELENKKVIKKNSQVTTAFAP